MGPPLSLSALSGTGDRPIQVWEPVLASRPYTLPLADPTNTVLFTTTGPVTRLPSPLKVQVCTKSLDRAADRVPALSVITAVSVTAGARAEPSWREKLPVMASKRLSELPVRPKKVPF